MVISVKIIAINRNRQVKMSKGKSQENNPQSKEEQLAALQAHRMELEQKIRKLQGLIEGNSNYRNDIIFLSQDLNQVLKKIRDFKP